MPGASAVFLAGHCTYSNAAKQNTLGVLPKTLAEHGAVSEAIARQMAEGARAKHGADYALATTGIAISAQLELSGSEVAGIALSPIMHAAIYPENLAVIVTAALIATLLAGLYPAWQAGRVVPVETIRLV